MKRVLCILSVLWLTAAVQAVAAEKAVSGMTAEEALRRGYAPREALEAPASPAVAAPEPSPARERAALQGADSRQGRDAGRQPTRLTVPSSSRSSSRNAVSMTTPPPAPVKTRGRGSQPPSMSSAYPISAPAHPRGRKAEPSPTRLTTGRRPPAAPAAPAAPAPGSTPTPGWTPEPAPDQVPAPGSTPTPGWTPEPGQAPAAAPVIEPKPQPPVSHGYQFHAPHRGRQEAARTPTRLTTGRRKPAAPAVPASTIPGSTPTPGWTPEPGQTPAAAPAPAPDTRSPAEQRRDEKRGQTAVAPPPSPAAEEAPRPSLRSRREVRPRQTRIATRDEVLVPAADVAPAVLADEMVQAYHLFDSRYRSGLGKTREELADMWGFPMETMAEQDGELAVGFRQRGTIIKPEVKSGAAREVSYYSSTNTAQVPADVNVTPFSCLVVFWIDQGGEGKVVNGDAVGDCFVVESLQNVPVKFER